MHFECMIIFLCSPYSVYNPETGVIGGDGMAVTLKKDDLNAGKVIAFRDSNNKRLSFVSNYIVLTGVSGELDNVVFDLIGAYFDYTVVTSGQMPTNGNDQWNSPKIGNILYSGILIVLGSLL